jgi:outer membrane protein, heavy metal efflux system
MPYAQRSLLHILLAAVLLSLSPPLRAEHPPRTLASPRGDLPKDAEAVPSVSLSLEQVVALARAEAPNVALARAFVSIGRSAYAGARLSPIVNPSLEVFVDRGLTGTKDVTVQSNVWIPFEVSGQRELRVAEADALVALQEANLVDARAVAASDAVRAYGGVVVADARLRTLAGIVEVSRAEADVYRARLAAGDATAPDVTLAEVELARNSVALTESRADMIRALTELNRLTGLRLGAAPSGPLEPPKGEEPAAAEAVAARAPSVRASDGEATYYARARDRQGREAHPPVSLIVSAGRGDLGELRFGGGMSFTFPIARRNQGEQARADAERARALVERDVKARVIAATLEGLAAERQQVQRALLELERTAEPAAEAAVTAALERQRAGKGELLSVLISRRDLSLIKARRLDLVQREWSIVSDLVRLTGDLP